KRPGTGMVVPEEGALTAQAQDARRALASEVGALRREQDEKAEKQKHPAGQGNYTLVMGSGPGIYDATFRAAISFRPRPLDRPDPEPVLLDRGGGSVQRGEKPRQERAQKAVRPDLKAEIDGGMESDAHESHGDADAEDVDRVSEVPQRRPPEAQNEYHNACEKEQAADNPRFPQELQVVVVRLVPAPPGARRRERGETVLEGPQTGAEPDIRRQLPNDASPDDRAQLEGGLSC